MKSLTITQMESAKGGTTYRQAYCGSSMLVAAGLATIAVVFPPAGIAAAFGVGVMGTWFAICA